MDTNQLHQIFDLQNYREWMDRVIFSFQSGGGNISHTACDELIAKRDYCDQRLAELRG